MLQYCSTVIDFMLYSVEVIYIHYIHVALVLL